MVGCDPNVSCEPDGSGVVLSRDKHFVWIRDSTVNRPLLYQVVGHKNTNAETHVWDNNILLSLKNIHHVIQIILYPFFSVLIK